MDGPIETADVDHHRAVVDLNLNGVWLGIRAVVLAMVMRGGGSIVNISSIDGLAGVAQLSTYVATKFALTGMTKSLALELGDRGIRVNSVHPGIVDATHDRKMPAAAMERLRKAIARQPIKRMARVEEIADAVLFFASDQSSYCTRAELVVMAGTWPAHTATLSEGRFEGEGRALARALMEAGACHALCQDLRVERQARPRTVHARSLGAARLGRRRA